MKIELIQTVKKININYPFTHTKKGNNEEARKIIRKVSTVPGY